MAKSLNDILQRYKDVISGKLPPSKIEKLTTGENPGVDYADKMKDGRDFVAMHTVEKHPDRNGNGDDVFKGSTTKAKMERHGHEPKPKDIKVYNKTQQQNEDYELDETSGAKAERYKKAARSKLLHLAVHTKDGPDKNRKIVNRATGMERADRAIDKDIAKRSAAQKKRLGEAKDEREYGYEGDMAITQLKTICRNAEHLMKMMKPDTDLPEWVQSKITKAEDYITTAHDYLMSEMNEETEQLDEGPFGVIGKALMKRKLKKQIAKHDEKMDDISWEGQVPGAKLKMMTPDQDDRWAKEYDNAARKRKVLKRLTKEEVEELDEAKCNMTEAGKMCEVHGMKACSKEGTDSASDKEPRYNGKKKEGRQLITDKRLQEKLTKRNSVGEIISDFVHSDNPKFKNKSKEERKKMALGAYYSMHPEKSKKVNESVSDQRSSRSTASEKAREKIANALERTKLETMKHRMKMEQSAPAETIIKMPSGDVGDTGRV